MLETPEIVYTHPQHTAILHLTVPQSQIRAVMGPGIQEVRAAMAAQDIVPSGPWFNHHLRQVPDVYDFEICIPVATPIAPSGRVVPSQWPAMEVARTVYQGPYENLGAAWAEFEAWISAQGLTGTPDIWERYLHGPPSASDSSTFRTELSHPLVR